LKKLRTILLSNWIFYLIFFFSFCYCLVYVNIPRYSKQEITEKEFELIIDDIYIDGNYLNMKLIGKENLQASYYFSSLEEKETFIRDYNLGDKILVRGELSVPRNNTNHNLFNYKKYLYNEGIHYTLSIDNYKKISSNNNSLYKLKNLMIDRIEGLESAPYLYALILGEDRYIDEYVNNSYQTIGISHLFAISGMHISILSGLLLFLFEKFHFNVKTSYFIVIIFLFCYLFITGCSPSILRAVILFLLLSINKLFKFKIKTFNVYLLTISIIICIDPFIIFKVGFQFSFIVSGALIVFNSLINNCKNYFTKLFMTSFIAFLVGLPISLYNFYQINIFSFIYNLFFVPFLSFAMFPLTLITFVIPFFEPILLFVISVLENVSMLCMNLPGILIFRKSSIFIVLMYYIFIFLILRNWKRNKKLLIFFIFILLFHYNYNDIFKSNYLLFLDVGQGDSIFIHSMGESVLIDTGGRIKYSKEEWEERNHQGSISSNTIIPLLKSFGIRKLDSLLITHGDFDHMGEAVNLVNNFKVGKVIFNCGEFNKLEQDLINVLDKKKIPYYSCVKELNIDNNQLYFLQTKKYDNENDNSNVIYTELNGYKFMFMGDASITTEREILNKYNLPDIDVLKVGHHGSKTSSSKEFIDEINPNYSIISVGKNNRYGHPNKEALDNLKESKIYRTDEDGSITFKIKNNKLKIEICSP